MTKDDLGRSIEKIDKVMKTIKELRNFLENIESFLYEYWKETVLTLLLIVAFFILLNPYKTIYALSWVLFFICIPMVIWLWILTKKSKGRLIELQNKIPNKKDENKPIFLGDDEITKAEFDRLDISEDAKSFAKQVLNNGSKKPIIFGLDSPWGSGKTSYINLCESLVWKDKAHKDDVVIFRFKPMLLDDHRQNLATFFVDELIKTLKRENLYIGELGSDLKKLMRLFKGVSVSGISFNFSAIPDSTEKLLESVKKHSKLLEKKVIIIVDDLDRLYLEDIKAILGVIRNVFYTENMTFILCYDSNSINTFETRHKITQTRVFSKDMNNNRQDAEEGMDLFDVSQNKVSREYLDNRVINSYLEKFVQIKKSLIPGREQLMQLLKDLVISDQDRVEENPHLIILLKGIEELFAPESFWRYQPLIGDVRKIKRVANFLHAAGSDENMIGIDYAERDIAPIYLLRLALIYINFPAVFQKIYFSETGGAKGLFSVIYKFSTSSRNDDDKYANSKQFFEYLRILSDEESFLLHELFCVKCAEGGCKRKEWSDDSYPKNLIKDENFLRTSPMFNGHFGTSKNLEDYLMIIHDHRLRPKSEYHAFHKNRIQELNYKTVDEIFKQTPEYNVINGEESQERFFAASQVKDISVASANKVIVYIVKNLFHYSMLDGFSSIYDGLRSGLIYRLIWVLELRGWADEKGESYGNSDENVASLAIRILENDLVLGKSIADSLLETKQNPILVTVDFTRFIYACSDSTSIFNLRRALEIYNREKSTDFRKILSCKAFYFFYNSIIIKKINFLREIENMPDNLLLGDFSEFISAKFKKEHKNLSDEIDKTKTNIKAGLIYRFSSEENQSLGVYDCDLNTEKKIYDIMRDYLFGICFNIKLDVKNSELFMDYMLASFRHDIGRHGGDWSPSVTELYKILGEDRLRAYWIENNEKIKAHIHSLLEDKKVFTSNYWVSYRDDMENMLKELDDVLIIEDK